MGSQASAWLQETVTNFGDLSAALSEHWVKQAYTPLNPDLHFTQLAAEGGPVCWREVPVHDGQIVHFYTFPILSAQSTAVTVSADDPAAISSALTGVTAKVAMYMGWEQISDEGQDYTFGDQFGIMKETLAACMMRTVDTVAYTECKSGATTAAMANGAALASASVSSGSGSELNLQNLERMSLLLKTNNVRHYRSGAYKGVIHPWQTKDLRATTATREFVDIAKNIAGAAGQEALRSDFVSRVCGFDLYETTEVSEITTHAATSASAHQTIFAGYESLAMVSIMGNANKVPKKGTGPGRLIERPGYRFRQNAGLYLKGFGSAGVLDPVNRRASVGFKVRTVAKVLDANRIFQLYAYKSSV
jgi:N4-gp56 family major capsid protein